MSADGIKLWLGQTGQLRSDVIGSLSVHTLYYWL